ncbi:MAG: hypothetical protein AB7N76_07980 [Planctomycetota bacterium]
MNTRLKDEELCQAVGYEHLLLHYLSGAQGTIESIDQLGNFLMGFGVLALGYLLNQDLGLATRRIGAAVPQGAPLLTLLAWALAVGLLVAFVLVYIFRVLAGRAVHARDGREDAVGEVLDLPEDLDFAAFARDQRTFADFLRLSYRAADRASPAALLYARWTYVRYMCLRKLAEMNRMRALLGLAVVCATAFKVGLVYLGALS